MSFAEDLEIETTYSPYLLNRFIKAGFQVSKMQGKFSDFDFIIESNTGKVTTIELKSDVYALRTGRNTGNITLETTSYDKPSGIAATKSDIFVYQVVTKDKITELMFKSEELRQWLEIKKPKFLQMGDKSSRTYGYLVKITDIPKEIVTIKEIKL